MTYRTDPTESVTALNADYMPTVEGLAAAIKDKVSHIDLVWLYSPKPNHMDVFIELKWYASLTLGLFRWLTERRVRKVIRIYGTLGTSVEVNFF